MSRPAQVKMAHVAILLLLFVVTRGWAIAAGFHYLGNESVWLVQLLDLEILHHHLLRGLLHLHGQPPLFNMLIGVAEKIGGTGFGRVVAGFQLLLSLGAGIAVYFALILLDLPPMASFAVSLLLLLNPALVLWEFDALYTVIVYALHCFIALALVCFVRWRSNRALLWLMALAITLTLLRSSYQWTWVAAVFALLWWQMPENRRQILRVGLVGVLLAMAWPAKNYVMFRHFTSTTWGPYSVSRHWPGPPYDEPVAGWVRQGLLPTFNRPVIQQESAWLDRTWPTAKTGSPELDSTHKSDGAPNWNGLSRLEMLDQQAKEDRFLLRHDPQDYVRTMMLGMLYYLRPSSDYFTLGYPWWFWDPSVEQYQRIVRVDQAVDAVCCGIVTLRPVTRAGKAQAAYIPGGGRISSVCAGVVVAHLLVFGCLLSFFWGKRIWAGSREQRIVAMVLTLTVTYLFVLVTVVEVGENMRFRFETHALVVMVAAVFLWQVWEWRRGRRVGGPVEIG
ncbi:hypothetical protein [Granulicella sibirica]|uniref:Glycosyltransferase RgtA/B/C/D-like domain-containing protein n=1 Tax=Granulicella sibirica TaxID=2479048 RepID=A0A4Q0T228_9BACT|nr:hypothetical protein [Granulicella sibirica]RXH55611.1 hypothetical protein GRAN_2468 [Granulicella sibirica]